MSNSTGQKLHGLIQKHSPEEAARIPPGLLECYSREIEKALQTINFTEQQVWDVIDGEIQYTFGLGLGHEQLYLDATLQQLRHGFSLNTRRIHAILEEAEELGLT